MKNCILNYLHKITNKTKIAVLYSTISALEIHHDELTISPLQDIRPSFSMISLSKHETIFLSTQRNMFDLQTIKSHCGKNAPHIGNTNSNLSRSFI